MTYIEFERLMSDYTDKILAVASAHKDGKESPEYKDALQAAATARGNFWDAVRTGQLNTAVKAAAVIAEATSSDQPDGGV